MKHTINIRGVLIPNDYKWYYDYFEEDSTCPADVISVLDVIQDGDEIEVYINSPGGVIDVGSEIYTMLRKHCEKVKIYITGEACSAASIIAMAAYCEMSPTALMMVHCTSTGAQGNHNIMEKSAELLKTADKALSQAYISKSNMTEDEVIQMMEDETWLTANQAKEKGLIDAVMFEEAEISTTMVAGPMFKLPTNEQMEMVKRIKMEEAGICNSSYIQQRLKFLKLKGETR